MPNQKLEFIKNNFSRAAEKYDNFAEIQHYTAQKLVNLSHKFITKEAKILDLGCGTGFVKESLISIGSEDIFECDLSMNMLKKSQAKFAKNPKICCNFNQLPFAKKSFDIVISSFSLQWLDNFSNFFQEIYKILNDDGLLIFAVPTQESLIELKKFEALKINNLPEIFDLKKLLKNNGFKELFLNQEIVVQNFSNEISAINSIKNIGGNHSSKSEISLKTIRIIRSFYLKNRDSENRKFSLSWQISFFCFKK